MNTVSIEQLSFSFRKKKPWIEDLELHVPRGSVFGLLGPNGAGKSTLLRLIMGLLRPQKGNIRVLGQDIKTSSAAIFQSTGLLLEEPQLYYHLSARDNLRVFAAYRRQTPNRINTVLKLVDLDKAADQKVSTFSTGMKQRLGIALALLGNPELLILDEPINGLDPAGILEVRHLLQRLHQQENKTILVSSHILSELQQLCTHVGIINHGKLLYQGTLEELREQLALGLHLIIECDQPEKAAQLLKEQFFVVELHENKELNIQIKERTDTTRVNAILQAAGLEVYQFRIKEPQLEDLFMQLIQSR